MPAIRPPHPRAPATPTSRALRPDEPNAARSAPDSQHREMLAPPSTRGTRRTAERSRRGRALAVLLAGLVVLLGASLAISAAAAPHGPVAAQPAPSPPTPPPSTSVPDLPVPIPTRPSSSVTCYPGSLQDECRNPSPSITPPIPPPCTGEGCLPQPPGSAPPTGPGGPGQPSPPGEQDDECGITDIGACITEAIDGFFRGIVEAALNPLLDLLGRTLLSTPTPDALPRIGELWNNSWEILLLGYALLVLIGGVLTMSYQTLQTRHSVKEIAPRLVVGFLAGALSLWVATKAIQIANALSQAVLGEGVDPGSAGTALRELILSSLKGGIWIIFIGLVLAGLLVVLLVTYIVRVAITIILIAGAPLALMAHALPQTEGIAQWWWKAFGGCLAIQIGQSLTLVVAMRTILTPGGFTLFGPTVSGLINLLIALALVYILFKIPFWILGSLRHGRGRTLLGSIARGVIAYKTFGLLAGRSGGRGRPARASGGGGRGGGRGGRGAPLDAYRRTRTTAQGQYVLPLTGVRRTPRGPRAAPAAQPRASQGRQLALPLGDDWPENRPVLGRDGQYRLPLDVQRVTPTAPPVTPSGAASGRRRVTQLELPFDPYTGNRPTRSGQYPLPLDGVRRTPRPPSPPPPPPPAARLRATQPELPFDPYQGNRPARSGQYPLPLDGIHRVPAAKSAPAPSIPPPAPRPAPPAGRQLRLPLDLPTPARRPRPPARRPKPGGKKP